jgi:thioredoxin 1
LADGYPTILYFSSPTCGPCVRVKKLLEMVNLSFGNKITITEINILEQPEKAHAYKVFSIPTLIIGDRRMSVSIEKDEVVDAILQAFLSSVTMD